ncbi:MAG: rRNA pseudouridine synthase, partial [Candidatus Cloacimonetes bacterium]|nr:rRNA pseudouridine synthase [Candidatus Cloacimonadota bacterium]
YLAKCNVGSRRSVEKLIVDGRIKVNGEVISNLAHQINEETDEVKFDNKTIEYVEDKIYIMLNKPKNYLVSGRDDFDRKTVFDLLPDFGAHLFAIGRLDYMSEGLLLLTTDGDFANKIIHPRYKLPKLYKVKVKGVLEQDQIQKLRDGVMIEGKKTKPAFVKEKSKGENSSVLKITIFEGRKRQIRYMLKKVGSEVLELKRLQIGDVKLGTLPIGMWRVLKPNEVLTLIRLSERKQRG